MHGLGNDFVLIDLITQDFKLHTAHIKRIADRNFGIGCDQVILIEPPIESDRDFFYRIYNANGSEVEQCGNGARCAARFFYDSGFVFHSNPLLKADCIAGPVEFNIETDDSITVNMGYPNFQLDKIPFIPADQTSASTQRPTSSLTSSQPSLQSITLEEQKISFFPLSLGNPHAVIQVSDLEIAPVAKMGSMLVAHPTFPQGTNIEFMQILDPHNIRLRVYERGVGETFSCGSGACAAVVAGIRLGILESPVSAIFSTGALRVQWEAKSQPVYLNGPAISVFMGRFRV